jgi:hypothetical protein
MTNPAKSASRPDRNPTEDEPTGDAASDENRAEPVTAFQYRTITIADRRALLEERLRELEITHARLQITFDLAVSMGPEAPGTDQLVGVVANMELLAKQHQTVLSWLAPFVASSNGAG